MSEHEHRQLKIRVRESLRAVLAREAKETRSTLNAVIVRRLESLASAGAIESMNKLQQTIMTDQLERLKAIDTELRGIRDDLRRYTGRLGA